MSDIDIETLPRPERRRVIRDFRKSVKKAIKAQRWGHGASALLTAEYARFIRVENERKP